MRKTIVTVLLLQGCASWHGDGPAVVPQAERARAAELGSAGPTANKGIESVTVLGTIPLEGEIDGGAGRALRVREFLISPGGVVAVHQHDQRPGAAYILEGEMTEFRGNPPEPVVHRAGSVAFERTGVVHWWENRGAAKARALVVDIVTEPAK